MTDRTATIADVSLAWHHETQRVRSAVHAVADLAEVASAADPSLTHITRAAADALVQALAILLPAQSVIDTAADAAEA